MDPFKPVQVNKDNEVQAPVAGAFSANVLNWFEKQKIGFYAQKHINKASNAVLVAKLQQRIDNIK